MIDIAFRFLVRNEANISLAFVAFATLTFASRLLVVWESPLVNPVILGLASNESATTCFPAVQNLANIEYLFPTTSF